MTVKDKVNLKPLTKPNQYYDYDIIVEMTSELTCGILVEKDGTCRKAHNDNWWKLLDEVESEVFDYLNIEMSSEHEDNRFIYKERQK